MPFQCLKIFYRSDYLWMQKLWYKVSCNDSTYFVSYTVCGKVFWKGSKLLFLDYRLGQELQLLWLNCACVLRDIDHSFLCIFQFYKTMFVTLILLPDNGHQTFPENCCSRTNVQWLQTDFTVQPVHSSW